MNSVIVWVLVIKTLGGAYSAGDKIEITFNTELECEVARTNTVINNGGSKSALEPLCEPKRKPTSLNSRGIK